MSTIRLYGKGATGLEFLECQVSWEQVYPENYFSTYRVTVSGQTDWTGKEKVELIRRVPLCQYTSEIVSLRAWQVADAEKEKRLRKAWEGLETAATIASIVLPLVRLGSVTVSTVRAAAQATKILEYMSTTMTLVKGLVIDKDDLETVLAGFLLDQLDLKKKSFFWGLGMVMPQGSRTLITRRISASARGCRFRLLADDGLKAALDRQFEAKRAYAAKLYDYYSGKGPLPLDSSFLYKPVCTCKWCTPPEAGDKVRSTQSSSGAITTVPGGF